MSQTMARRRIASIFTPSTRREAMRLPHGLLMCSVLIVRSGGPARLARCRRAAGLSQSGLAARLGVDQSLIAHWERGRGRPSLELAVRLERLTAGAVRAEDWIPRARPRLAALAQDLTG